MFAFYQYILDVETVVDDLVNKLANALIQQQLVVFASQPFRLEFLGSVLLPAL